MLEAGARAPSRPPGTSGSRPPATCSTSSSRSPISFSAHPSGSGCSIWPSRLAGPHQPPPPTRTIRTWMRSSRWRPFGLGSIDPAHERATLAGVVDGIGTDDRILIWGGGLYSWFDPKTLIRAVAALARRRPETKLFFLGTRHPGVDEDGDRCASRTTSRENSARWIPRCSSMTAGSTTRTARTTCSRRRPGVSTHESHVETEFAFRTRILDLPVGGVFRWWSPRATASPNWWRMRGSAWWYRPGTRPHSRRRSSACCSTPSSRHRLARPWPGSGRDSSGRWLLAPLVEFVREPHHAADYTGDRRALAPHGFRAGHPRARARHPDGVAPPGQLRPARGHLARPRPSHPQRLTPAAPLNPSRRARSARYSTR